MTRPISPGQYTIDVEMKATGAIEQEKMTHFACLEKGERRIFSSMLHGLATTSLKPIDKPFQTSTA